MSGLRVKEYSRLKAAQTQGGSLRDRASITSKTSSIRSSKKSPKRKSDPKGNKSGKEEQEEFLLCGENQRTQRRSFLLRNPNLQREPAAQVLERISLETDLISKQLSEA